MWRDRYRDNGPALREVNLVRPGACTHSADNEQRAIDLEFTSTAPDSITITLPSNPTLAPPGGYPVLVVNDQGVPPTGTVAAAEPIVIDHSPGPPRWWRRLSPAPLPPWALARPVM